ncbi:MAG: primosomal protein N' [Veillonellaceae bacterium]|jgi:primosomal protein N' (replication factor Y)|nr:primosomal protein N' [Veillonellaceae bacterium]
MGNIAQIIVNVTAKAINKSFSYYIPDELSFLEKGYRVLVPFGPQKVEGFVIDIIDGNASNLKPIISALDDYAWFDDNMLKTADWVAKFYLCTQAEALRLFVPGKSGIKTEFSYSIPDSLDIQNAAAFLSAKPDLYLEVLAFIAKNVNVKLAQLNKQFGQAALKALKYLEANKLVYKEMIAHSTKRIKYQNNIALAVQKSVGLLKMAELNRSPAQQRLLTVLLEKASLTPQELKELHIAPNTVKKLVDAGIAKIIKTQILRDSYSHTNCNSPILRLTPEQQNCLVSINSALHSGDYQSCLIHGITGSGKTQVYIEAVAETRRNNRQAIVLVPEIALTSQIVARFKAYFGDDVVVIHSKLSIAERYDAWQKLRTNQAGIAIGARSAIFAPLTNLGLIIIDEEHEFTYKQEESPRYHARQVAEIRSRLAKALLILGSATPSIETYYKSLLGKHTLLTINERIDGAALPHVTVVDMREELRLGRRTVLSQPLQQLLSETIENGEQAVLLLNRRGYATFVLCRECGYVMECEHCSSTLVYHTSGNTLRCHYCQSSQVPPDTCPNCSSRYIRYFGTGTQKLEEELFKLWPNIRVIRMDQDTTSRKMAYSRILSDFAAGRYDILLGTQMVAKGHDIKNVTAVGIIAADTTLNLPDFRAAERTFSLITQAAGRAGRGNKPGKVVIQTYNPDHYALQAGANQDYFSFYQTEISHRKELFYPPFSHIVKLTITNNDERQIRIQAENIASQLRKALASEPYTEVIGPFNAAIFKVKDTFRVNLMIKTVRLATIRHHINNLGLSNVANIYIDIEPVNVM